MKDNVIRGPWPERPEQKPKPSASRRREEFDVVCRAAPDEAQDCVDVPGWLVLDYEGDAIKVALFDPAIDAVPNAELSVSGQLVSDTQLTLTDAESAGADGAPERWVFERVEDAEALAEQFNDEIQIDFDDVEDDDIDWDHPFNEGLT